MPVGKYPPRYFSRWVTDDFGTRRLMKRCPRCQRWQERDAANYGWLTKKGRRVLDGWCRECRRAEKRAYYRADPERSRERFRERHRAERKDPERLARRRQINRAAQERYRKRRKSLLARYRQQMGYVRVGPFRSWLEVVYRREVDAGPGGNWSDASRTWDALAARLRTSDRRIRSVLNGEQERVHFNIVDAALTYYDRPVTVPELGVVEFIWDLYPELDWEAVAA